MMTDLLAARLTMALSLGFHIILAAIGMIMPFLMAIAHDRWLRTQDEDAYRLTRLWTRGVAIFFATGAVSGTALSFELGVLWPGFMEHAGPIIGMPFSLEGAAFFVEAIALGIYLYGWERLSPRLHWTAGLIVGFSGLASGILVISANGWMNSPTGFIWENGAAHSIDPWKAFFNDAWLTQGSHMLLASFEAVGFAVAGIHAFLLLRGSKDPMHKAAVKIAFCVGSIAAILQPINGHWAAQDVAVRQPAKLAAMEAHFTTSRQADLLIGGIPDEESQEVHYGIHIPGGLSFLAFNDFDAEVIGLDQIPKDEWPPVLVVHFAFQIMVAIGTFLAMFALIGLFVLWKRPSLFYHQRFLKMLVLSIPLGFIAIEAGWIVTEVGRQPWIIYGIMKTKEALTPVPGQFYHLLSFGLLYTMIGVSTVWMWSRQVAVAHRQLGPSPEIKRWAHGDDS